MSNRLEEKFILSTLDKNDFLLENYYQLIHDYEALKFNNSYIYQVNSMYFDTPTMESYNQKVNGEKYKYKLRLRDYADQNYFLELKLKEGHLGSKVRVKFKDMDSSYQEILKILGPSSIAHFNLPLNVNSFHKTLFVSYTREAYRILGSEDVKINFDSDIVVRNPQSIESRRLSYDSILEIKYSSDINKKFFNLRPYKTEFSKYQRGVEDVYSL